MSFSGSPLILSFPFACIYVEDGDLINTARDIVESNFPDWAIYMVLAVAAILCVQALFCVCNHKNEIKKLSKKNAEKIERIRQDAMARTMRARKDTTVDIDQLPEISAYLTEDSQSRSCDNDDHRQPRQGLYGSGGNSSRNVMCSDKSTEKKEVVVLEVSVAERLIDMENRVQTAEFVDRKNANDVEGSLDHEEGSSGQMNMRRLITVVPDLKSKPMHKGERRLSVPNARRHKNSSNRDRSKQKRRTTDIPNRARAQTLK